MKRSSVIAVFALALVAGIITVTLALLSREPQQQPQASGAFIGVEALGAIENLARLLEENFIYPEIGKAYAKMLRGKLADGAYSKFSSAEEFANVVTANLQAVHPEGHLSLIPPGGNPSGNPASEAPASINGVGKVGWLAPEVGYMSIHGFQGDRTEYTNLMNRLRAALDCLSTAKTLIIDARPYVGGAFEETDIMSSYFFDKPTTLLELDTRLAVEQRGFSPLVEGDTLRRITGPEGIVRRAQVALPSSKETALMKARIFVLVSKKTASGGEGFALSLKRTGRATLIGETTAGAGHFGSTTDLGGGYRAFIPIGRPFDPDTGKGWEQTGVEPHIKTPAERALDEALERAGVKPAAAKGSLESLKTNQPPC